jgi:fumarate hydratase, class II
VMQPLVAWNLLTAVELLSGAAQALAARAVAGFTVNEERIAGAVRQNPILVTALAPRIGYDRCAAIVHHALESGRGIEEVAREESGLSAAELKSLLDPARMTRPGFPE